MTRDVASFWVRGPDVQAPWAGWDGERTIPFHAPSQPAEGLDLVSRHLETPFHVSFVAELRAMTSAGDQVNQYLTIPVRVAPR
jgi:hypothetical protein